MHDKGTDSSGRHRRRRGMEAYLRGLTLLISAFGTAFSSSPPVFEPDTKICAELGITEANTQQRFGTGPECFWVEPQIVDWEGGMAKCAEKGGHLAHFKSSDSLNTLSFNFGLLASYWVGWRAMEGEKTASLYVGGNGEKLPGEAVINYGKPYPDMAMPSPDGNFCWKYHGGSIHQAACKALYASLCMKSGIRAKFSPIPGKTLAGHAIWATKYEIEDSWLCGLECIRAPGCVAIEYFEEFKKCKLSDRKFADFESYYNPSESTPYAGEVFNRLY